MKKRSLNYIVSTAYIFCCTYILPLFFLIAFNFSKGIQANEDGLLFMPLGFLVIFLTLLFDVLFIKKALKMNRDNRRTQLILAAVFVVAFMVPILITFSAWKDFFKCLMHYRGLNLDLQIR